MQMTVYITTQFPMFHRWAKAPEDVSVLREWHRHIFHVKAWKEVTHDDRDIEFITLKTHINGYIARTFYNRRHHFSCEMIAEMLINEFGLCRCDVSEDGENGAEVWV